MFAVYDATGCSNDQAEAAAKGERAECVQGKYTILRVAFQT